MWLVSWFCEFTYKILSSARPAAEGASKPPGLKSSWGERFANSVRLLRDGFFLLLGRYVADGFDEEGHRMTRVSSGRDSIAINQSSFGITRSVLAITWTLFALFVVWSIVKLFTLSGCVESESVAHLLLD